MELRNLTNIFTDAHYEHPLSMLWYPFIMWAEDYWFIEKIITGFLQFTMNHLPGVTVIVGCKVPDILQENVFRMMILNDTHNIKEQGSLGRIIKAEPLTGFRKSLTREASTQYIVFGDILRFNFCNIPDRTNPIVFIVGLLAVLINIRGKNALSTEFCHCLMEPSNATKKVYKSKFIHYLYV